MPVCVVPQARVPCFKRALPLLKPEGGILLLGASYHAAATPPQNCFFSCVHSAAAAVSHSMAGLIASRLYPTHLDTMRSVTKFSAILLICAQIIRSASGMQMPLQRSRSTGEEAELS